MLTLFWLPLVVAVIVFTQLLMLWRSHSAATARQIAVVRNAGPTRGTNWAVIEAHFESSPYAAVVAADECVSRVLKETGSADIALLEDYHIARALCLKAKRHAASTADPREAMDMYRTVFDRVTKSSLHQPSAHNHLRLLYLKFLNSIQFREDVVHRKAQPWQRRMLKSFVL